MLGWRSGIGSALGHCRSEAGHRIYISPRYRAKWFAQQTRQESTLPNLPFFRAVASHDPDAVSVVHSASGRSFTYGNLVADVLLAQDRLSQLSGKGLKRTQLRGKPVAFLAENSYDYVGTVFLLHIPNIRPALAGKFVCMMPLGIKLLIFVYCSYALVHPCIGCHSSSPFT